MVRIPVFTSLLIFRTVLSLWDMVTCPGGAVSNDVSFVTSWRYFLTCDEANTHHNFISHMQ